MSSSGPPPAKRFKKEFEGVPRPPTPLRELHSLFNCARPDNLVQTISRFIYDELKVHPNIEIEARLGKIMQRANNTNNNINNNNNNNNTNNSNSNNANNNNSNNIQQEDLYTRLDLGILNTTVIDNSKLDTKFVSGVEMDVFQHLNKLLNGWYSNANAKPEERIKELLNQTFPNIRYKKCTEIDKIYDNCRVTLNPHNLEERKCIKKERVKHIDIYCPGMNYDIRISASIENSVPPPSGQQVILVRSKERMSYIFDEIFSIDITRIYQYNHDIGSSFIEEIIQSIKKNNNMPRGHGLEIFFEIELEIIEPSFFREQRNLLQNKQPNNCFSGLCDRFIHHCLHLVETATHTKYMPKVCKLPNLNN